MAFHYEVDGASIESDFPLHALTYARPEGALPTLCLRMASSSAPTPASAWEARRTVSDSPWLSIARFTGGYLLRIRDLADFTLDLSAPGYPALLCHPDAGCPRETLEHLILDQVFPLALHSIGRFSFHASSVVLDGFGVVAFLGNSGLGKSTLASSLARFAGAALFSDDCLAVTATSGVAVAHPSYAFTRLYPASAEALIDDWRELPIVSPRTDKRRVSLPAERSPRPLRRLYLLERSESAPVIAPLRPRDALAALAAHLYRLDFEDRALLAQEIALLGQIVSDAVVARLAYRRSFTDISAVHEVIRADTR